MGKFTYQSFLKNKNYEIKGIILPEKNSLYKTNILVKNINKDIKILNNNKLKKIYNFIKNLKPDLVLVSTFNKILNSKILNITKFINIHHGKLPKQKGRASINWALIMGRNNIYITIHEINKKLDGGKILKQKKIFISKEDNYFKIQSKINFFLKNNLTKIVTNYLANKIKLKKNLQKNESWNCSRNPQDSMINFFDKKSSVINLIRGVSDKKFGAYCFLKEKKIIILEASISKINFEGIIPGRVTKVYKNGSIDCLCIDGPININKIMFKNKIMKPAKLIKSTRDTLLND